MHISPKKLAIKMLKKYKDISLQDILNILHVIVIDTIPLVDTNGFYQYVQRNHIIYINCNLDPHEKNFVIAHEIGHMLMHKNQNAVFLDSRSTSSLDKFECQANTFAVEYLLPDTYLQENSEFSIYELARIQGVPQEFVNLKQLS